eukprot:1161446-Pelagomonas_calceolata.AAC.7
MADWKVVLIGEVCSLIAKQCPRLARCEIIWTLVSVSSKQREWMGTLLLKFMVSKASKKKVAPEIHRGLTEGIDWDIGSV